jgi:hypothetical protein
MEASPASRFVIFKNSASRTHTSATHATFIDESHILFLAYFLSPCCLTIYHISIKNGASIQNAITDSQDINLSHT